MRVVNIVLMMFIVSLMCHSKSLAIETASSKSPASTKFDSSINNINIDLSGIQFNLAGGPVEALVLGTPHLSARKEQIPQEHLSLLLDKLIEFSPDIIAIESSNGISCATFKKYQAVYGQVWENYCFDPTHIQQSLKVTPPQALAKAYKFLDLPESQITNEVRREMIAYFFAAGWADSATMQWLQLSLPERTAQNGINEELKAWLDKRILSANESVAIAAKLGAKLGLRYLHPMDDHTADIVYLNAPNELWQVIQSVWKHDSASELEYQKKETELLGSPEGVLAYYRFLNSQWTQQVTIDADFGAAAQRTDSNNIARRYLAWWQSRGLKMAANVVEATARNPSAKVLVLVGASHKTYFDAYLNQMHDFKLIPVNSVLN